MALTWGHYFTLIEEALDELASVPDGVAAELLRKGYRGRRGRCTECPVALWLNWRWGNGAPLLAVRIYSDEWYVGDAICREPNMVPVPKAVSAFVEAFDAGQHPELEAPWPGGSEA